jgi:ABC-2 type transport system ATP-binding protein
MNVVEAVCDRVVIIHQGRVVVNEKVSSLLQLFQSKAVRCTFDLSLDHAQESTLRSRFDVVSVAATADEGGQIDVNLQDGKQVYDLIDALRGQGMAIRSLERRSPDLEEVFLSYVQGA